MAALKLSLWTSLVVAAVNAVAGTATAWVLVRDRFRGKAALNALIDLPFALPTIVVGIILLALVGPTSPGRRPRHRDDVGDPAWRCCS